MKTFPVKFKHEKYIISQKELKAEIFEFLQEEGLPIDTIIMGYYYYEHHCETEELIFIKDIKNKLRMFARNSDENYTQEFFAERVKHVEETFLHIQKPTLGGSCIMMFHELPLK